MSCGCWHTDTVSAHRQLVSIDDGDGVVGAIAGDGELAVGRNSRHSGRAANANGRDHGALGEVDHRNICRTGIGDIGTLAVRRNRHVIGRAMNADDGRPPGCVSASMMLMLLESALAT